MDTRERQSIRERFLKVDTSNAADALDEMGLMNQGLSADFGPYPSTTSQIAGFAYTIRGQMTQFPLGGDADKMLACHGISADEVSVWSGNGEGVCYFGELIAIGLKERGSVGALVDGGIRDIRWLRHHDFPVFAKYRTPVQSIGRWKVNACQVPVEIVGATSRYVKVCPGDFILGDDDGVLAIPSDVIMEVLTRAEELTAKEVKIRAELVDGLSLAEALKKFGHV